MGVPSGAGIPNGHTSILAAPTGRLRTPAFKYPERIGEGGKGPMMASVPSAPPFPLQQDRFDPPPGKRKHVAGSLRLPDRFLATLEAQTWETHAAERCHASRVAHLSHNTSKKGRMTVREENWLARWSRRKSARRAEENRARDPRAQPAALIAESSEKARAPKPVEHDSANLGEYEADLDGLDAQSNYKPFLNQGVPPEVRSAALRRLWSSDPVFSQLDGLQDYADDFTDGAAVPSEPLATAYKIGCGFAGQVLGPEKGGGRLDEKPSEADQTQASDAERASSRQGRA
jgi:hypothetical protein